MGVDGAALDRPIMAPHVFEQLFTREHLIGSLHELEEQLEFFDGHENFVVVDPQLQAALVHAEGTDLDDLIVVLADLAQMFFDERTKGVGADRLTDKCCHTQIVRANFIGFFFTGREYEDQWGQSGEHILGLFEEIIAVLFVSSMEIEHEDVDARALHASQRRLSFGFRVKLYEARGRLLHKRMHVDVVVENEKAR